jgi:hypothetical protein
MSDISKYLAAIGAKGGKASRRTLTKAQAQAMVKARTAKRAKKLESWDRMEPPPQQLGKRETLADRVRLLDDVSKPFTSFIPKE